MAVVPPVTVPLTPLVGNARLGLDCLPCTDEAIEARHAGKSGDEVPEVAEADTMAPLAQTFSAGGQTIMAINVVPVCRRHRAEQLKAASSRLAVA